MARNSYPEETINRILDVSMALFVEQGYEETSIQNIIDALGDLSKGAIYYHFKSKEDILLAALDRVFLEHDKMWQEILADDSGITGLQKLRNLFWVSIGTPHQSQLFSAAPDMLKNPKMLSLQMMGIMEESAPSYVAPIIKKGIEDGSIVTDYPDQLAEVILLLINLWVTPMVFPAPMETLERRLQFYKEILGKLGVDFMDKEMMEGARSLARIYMKNHK